MADLEGRSFRRVLTGAAWAVGGQLATAAVQVLYTGFTARAFPAAAFGEFAIAVSLQSLVILLTTTGLPSFVLATADLSCRDMKRVRLLAVTGGLIGALILSLAGPVAFQILGVPGAATFLPCLSFGVLIAGLSGCEMALLRRARRARRDAAILVASNIFAVLIAVTLAVALKARWVLAIPAGISPAFTLILIQAFSRPSLNPNGGAAWPDITRYSARVSIQNMGFFINANVSTWVTGRLFGASPLGQLSRAQALTQMPAAAVANGASWIMQPYWNSLRDPDKSLSTRRDLLTLTCAVALPIFGVTGVLAPDLVRVWLGRGWDEAAILALPLALAAALSIPFQSLASSCEMLSDFESVRRAQIVQFFAILGSLGLAWLTASLFALSCGLLLVASTSLLTLAWFSGGQRPTLISALIEPGLWSAVPLGVAALAEALLRHAITDGGVVHSLVRIFSSGALAIFAWLISLRWQRVTGILRDRGIKLPSVLTGSTK